MNNISFNIGVIISTYNNPEWLKKVLWGYTIQTHSNFELIIADDGSGKETYNLIEEFKRKELPQIKHVWHPDNGFQKCKILNKAILASNADYLIFTDQDCIPRKDYIETHLKYAKNGYILSGGYFKLPMKISKEITYDDIILQNPFHLSWLKQRGLKMTFKNTKLIHSPFISSLMNFITPTKATWNGCNSSGWKKDMLAIKGFNELMQYGGEDREFGERLFNMGIKSKQIRYSAICIHLDHKRPYKNETVLIKNKLIRKETKKLKLIQTNNGINKD